MVDPLLSALVTGYGRFGPTALGIAMSGGVRSGNGPYPSLVPASSAAGVSPAATLLLVLAGGIATHRRGLA